MKGFFEPISKYVNFLKRYKSIIPNLVFGNSVGVYSDGEYWHSYMPFAKKCVIFRWDIQYGQGSLLPALIESFMWADEQGFEPYVMWGDYGVITDDIVNINFDNEWETLYSQDYRDARENGSVLVGAKNTVYSSQTVRQKLYKKRKYERGYIECGDPDWRVIFQNYNYFYKKYFALNGGLVSIIEAEWADIKSDDKMLAVILREEFSIDRNLLKEGDALWKHPWVKRVKDILPYVETVMKRTGCNRIYVSTAFEDSIDLFREYFGIKKVVATNRIRDKFSEYERFRVGLYNLKRKCKRREIQSDAESHIGYQKDMIYASRCDCMVGQQCSGTRMALIMNGGEYEFYEMIPNYKQLDLIVGRSG